MSEEINNNNLINNNNNEVLPIIKRPIKTNRLLTPKKVWLVKIPTEVAEIWKEAKEKDMLGNLSFQRADKNQITINIKTNKPSDYLTYKVINQEILNSQGTQYCAGNFTEITTDPDTKPSPIFWEGGITVKAILQAELNDKVINFKKYQILIIENGN